MPFWGGVAILAVHVWMWRPALLNRTIELSVLAAAATAVVALLTGAASVHFGSTVVGGADSFGYLSQAGLWQQRELLVAATSSGNPRGRSRSRRGRRSDIVRRPAASRVAPLYPPGLPLLMAGVQQAFGYCAAFVIVPSPPPPPWP
jgi:hypothetical protein